MYRSRSELVTRSAGSSSRHTSGTSARAPHPNRLLDRTSWPGVFQSQVDGLSAILLTRIGSQTGAARMRQPVSDGVTDLAEGFLGALVYFIFS